LLRIQNRLRGTKCACRQAGNPSQFGGHTDKVKASQADERIYSVIA
jgi:hypothetical protein